MTTANGWESLGAILRTNEELLVRERAERPSTCPNDGHILEDVRGVLHCVFGGEVFDYTGNPVYDYPL